VRALRDCFLRAGGGLRAGWRVVLFLGSGSLANGAAMDLLRFTGLDAPVVARIWTSALVYLLVSWLALRLEGRGLGSLGLEPGRRWGLQFLAGAAGGGLFMGLVASVIRGLDGFHWARGASGGLVPMGSGAWLFLAAAFREELAFRGYGFQRLVDGAGEWPALGLMGLYFAYAHWHNPGMTGQTWLWASLNIGLAGILMGLGYLRTRSLALPIGLHLGWNWTQGSLLGFGVSGTRPEGFLAPVFHGRPSWLTGGDFGPEASLPCAVLCGLAIAALAAWKPRWGDR